MNNPKNTIPLIHAISFLNHVFILLIRDEHMIIRLNILTAMCDGGNKIAGN